MGLGLGLGLGLTGGSASAGCATFEQQSGGSWWADSGVIQRTIVAVGAGAGAGPQLVGRVGSVRTPMVEAGESSGPQSLSAAAAWSILGVG